MSCSLLFYKFCFALHLKDAHSFQEVDKWIEDVRDQRGSDVIIMLVGHNADPQNKRQVSKEEGMAKARELSVMFIESCAESGYNVKEVGLDSTSLQAIR